MFNKFYEKVLVEMGDSLTKLVVDKLKETATTFWDALGNEEEERAQRAIKNSFSLLLRASLSESRKKTLKSDLKSALNTISADMTATIIRARESTDDPVLKGLFNLTLEYLYDTVEE